ncbi:secretin N-terminal domain-containing protein [Marinicellulosiphila megalodicopiae]|uniref:secretin N-terminal domain-containing protein n=1 Tax=Marinicellulosiphila megalodicopiae TaxID=2724896 RepID=UPI003BB189F6
MTVKIQAFALTLLCLFSPLTFSKNYDHLKEITLNELINIVGDTTGKSFVINDTLEGSVKLFIDFDNATNEQLFELLNQTLLLNNYGLVDKGSFYVVMPTGHLKNKSSKIDTTGNPQSSEVITETIELKNIKASNAVDILRPLVSKYGYITQIESSRVNSIIIVDHADNIQRLSDLIIELDQP